MSASVGTSGDPQRPSTWTRYSKGNCEGCWGGCCTLPLEASAADLMRLGVLSEDEASQITRAVIRRLQSEGIIRRYSAKTGIFVIEQQANGDCIYLNQQRLCKVYEDRPAVCRKFPQIGPRPGFCPRRLKAQKS